MDKWFIHEMSQLSFTAQITCWSAMGLAATLLMMAISSFAKGAPMSCFDGDIDSCPITWEDIPPATQ